MRRSCSTISRTARPPCCRACRRWRAARCPWSNADVRDAVALRSVFHDHPIAAVVHCAGLKAVGESEERPLAYYDVNVGGAIALAEVMGEAGVATLVFSSSATVYGQPDDLPVDRGRAAAAAERLRPHQARRRGLPARPRARERQLAHRDPALLQSCRRARLGHARRSAARTAAAISCRCCAGSRRASSAISRSTAATGRRPTARAFATTCTSRISPRATSRRCAILAQGARRDDAQPGRGSRAIGAGGVAAFEKACGRRITQDDRAAAAGDVAAYYADPSRAEKLLGLARRARPRRDLRRRVAVAEERRAILNVSKSLGPATPGSRFGP